MWGSERAEHQLLHTWDRDSKKLLYYCIPNAHREAVEEAGSETPENYLKRSSKLKSRSSGLSGSDGYQARKERAALPQECQCQE